MPIVTIQITREGTTPEQKAALIKGATELLVNVLNKPPGVPSAGRKLGSFSTAPARAHGSRSTLYPLPSLVTATRSPLRSVSGVGAPSRSGERIWNVVPALGSARG